MSDFDSLISWSNGVFYDNLSAVGDCIRLVFVLASYLFSFLVVLFFICFLIFEFVSFIIKKIKSKKSNTKEENQSSDPEEQQD